MISSFEGTNLGDLYPTMPLPGALLAFDRKNDTTEGRWRDGVIPSRMVSWTITIWRRASSVPTMARGRSHLPTSWCIPRR
jgi:hypothetical protein